LSFFIDFIIMFRQASECLAFTISTSFDVRQWTISNAYSYLNKFAIITKCLLHLSRIFWFGKYLDKQSEWFHYNCSFIFHMYKKQFVSVTNILHKNLRTFFLASIFWNAPLWSHSFTTFSLYSYDEKKQTNPAGTTTQMLESTRLISEIYNLWKNKKR
jgi:hypothetical protein